MLTAIRQTIQGCGHLPGYGPHPGVGALVCFVIIGAIAGGERGPLGAAIGAGVMLAVLGPMFLIGAYSRGRAADRG